MGTSLRVPGSADVLLSSPLTTKQLTFPFTMACASTQTMASSAPPSATAGPTRVFFSFTSGFLESGSPELAPWEEKKTAAVALATSKIQATQVENLNAGAVSEQPCDIPAPAGEVTEAAPITTRRPVWYKAALLAAAVLLQ